MRLSKRQVAANLSFIDAACGVEPPVSRLAISTAFAALNKAITQKLKRSKQLEAADLVFDLRRLLE